MPRGRPKVALVLSDSERDQLLAMTRSRSMPHALVRRAQIVLMSVDGANNIAIAEALNVSRLTVGTWRRRFMAQRIAGLYDELRPGGPRSIRDEQVATLVRKTIKKQPRDGTHWSCRSLAAETKLSKSTVQRVWQAFGLQPHRQKHFKLSTDPFFVEKVRDVVGLYLNPPDHAIVLGVDEKSQIQALDRTQPMLPLGLGDVEGVTHDYERHGTTTLFAALDLASGGEIYQYKTKHRHQKDLRFLKQNEGPACPELRINSILDNYAT